MATTTNYGWTTPNDTDLVKDGAAAIRTLGSSVDTTTKALNPSTTLGDLEYRSATANTNTRLAVGTTGQVLTVAGGVPTWATSDDANAIQNAIVDAKGDIVAASAADTPARLAVGTDNQRLVAASGEATGLKYVSDTQNTVIDAAGDLVYGTAADTLGRLAIGTAGQVLKVNSGATAPEWGAAGGASGLTLVQRSTFSNVADTGTTFDNVFTSTYLNYLVTITYFYAGTTADDAQFQMMQSGTAVTSLYFGGNTYVNSSGTTATIGMSNASQFTVAINSGTSAYYGSGNINFFNVGNSAIRPKFTGTWTESSADASYTFGGSVDTAAAIYTGFKLKSASSNVTGEVSVYGLAKA
jgi:hypothetical protein